jgi:hypothetical protein
LFHHHHLFHSSGVSASCAGALIDAILLSSSTELQRALSSTTSVPATTLS